MLSRKHIRRSAGFQRIFLAGKDLEKDALAKYLEISPDSIADTKSEWGLPTFKVGEEIYCVSDNDQQIKKAVEDSLENLFNELVVEEFCEKVIPYLRGSAEDYIESLDDELSIEEQLQEGMLNMWGYEYRGYVDYDKMAQDVIDIYGAGHEIALYDGITGEVDIEGSTFYIFRQE